MRCLETPSNEAANKIKIPSYQAVEKVLRDTDRELPVSEVIDMKVNSLTKPQDFSQHLISNFIKTLVTKCI